MSEQPTSEVVLYEREGGPALEVRLDGETVWLTQQQLADLFQTTQQNISLHLRNIYDEGELSEEATHKDLLSVRAEGPREVQRRIAHYNLDATISVGYRVQSRVATRFRVWATERLRDYLVKGFAMDDARLKNLGGGSYWRELLERIRDIRSSEKVLYRQVLELYATSLDYDKTAPESAKFFAIVQNKLHFAAHGHTAAEVIFERADSTKPNMGLTNFEGEHVRKSDVSVAKNYLTESESQKLRTLVSAYFDAAEFRAQRHEPTYMKDWLAHLDRLIAAMDAPVLANAGSVSSAKAKAKAEEQYVEFRSVQAAETTAVEAAYLDTIKQAQRRVEGKPGQ